MGLKCRYGRTCLVQGSNGEVAYLTEEERVAMIKAVRDVVPKQSGKLIIAGMFWRAANLRAVGC